MVEQRGIGEEVASGMQQHAKNDEMKVAKNAR
jgi:hypothetical protein